MLKKAICLLAICSAAKSSEIDQLIDSSSAIVDQIDRGIKLAVQLKSMLTRERGYLMARYLGQRISLANIYKHIIKL